MSYPADENQHRAHVASVVRRNVWPAAIAAVLLCYYGFQALVEPQGGDLFTRSNWVFFHTVRIGGVAMAVLAVWCWLGRPAALAVDGVVSMAIGVSFILSGGGMLIDSGGSIGFNTILIILFGMMFFGSGRHNWQTYRHLAAGGRVVVEQYTETFTPPVRPAAPATRSPDPAPGVATPVRPIEDACAADTTPTEQGDTGEEEPPPEGFLAAMAKKPPPSEP